jgi:hypothetical protein
VFCVPHFILSPIGRGEFGSDLFQLSYFKSNADIRIVVLQGQGWNCAPPGPGTNMELLAGDRACHLPGARLCEAR